MRRRTKASPIIRILPTMREGTTIVLENGIELAFPGNEYHRKNIVQLDFEDRITIDTSEGFGPVDNITLRAHRNRRMIIRFAFGWEVPIKCLPGCDPYPSGPYPYVPP